MTETKAQTSVPRDQRSEYDAQAVAAREVEILGKPQRVPPLPIAAVTPGDWEMVNGVRAVIGLGPATDMAGYTLTMLRRREILQRQLEMGVALFRGALPARERELAVLRLAWLLGAPYEWSEHVDIGRRCGVTTEEIERIIEGPSAPVWSEHEAAILRAVGEILRDQTISDATWAVLEKTWTVEQLLEFPMVVGQYVCTAIVQNTLRIRLESGRTGLNAR